jgi:hypothetical protein
MRHAPKAASDDFTDFISNAATTTTISIITIPADRDDEDSIVITRFLKSDKSTR